MQEFEEDALPTSSFQTYSAEADHLAKNGEYKQAVMAYTNALTLRPNDKACLVFRSRCYLLMGDASSALNDANASLAGDKTYFKGIFSKAESLYATGDFEMALVYYHRGNKLRPEFNDFRLGIQKASEAIDNSIGSTFNCVDACLDPRDYKIRSQANGRSISGKTSGLPMRKAAEIVTVPKAVKAEKEKEFEVKVKQLLGELYVDRKYLEQFLVDKGILEFD
jgi:tetratricopeptide (TPR) repeat protein